MKPKTLHATAELIAGALLVDAETALPLIEQAGGLPSGIAYSGDAELVFRTVANLKRDGVPLTTLAIREGCGLDAKRVDRLADNAPLVSTVWGKVRALHKHVAREASKADLSDDKADEAEVLARINARLSPFVDDGAGVAPVDASAWLANTPPPHDPVLLLLIDILGLLELVGPSKTRKTFILMQLVLGLVSGCGAFGFQVARAFRVLLVDMELSAAELWRRVHHMSRAMGISAADIGDRLHILPIAGSGDPCGEIDAAIARVKPDITLVDPLYCLGEGGETIEDLRPVMRWLRKLATKQAMVGYIHHDSKGFAGERNTRDRGSGSGITGRAVDARITVTPAASDPDNSIVMQFMCRAYKTPPPSVWTFDGHMFVASELPADVETANGSRARAGAKKLSTYEAGALAILKAKGPLSPALFKQHLREELSMSKNDADVLSSKLVESGAAVRWRAGGFHPSYMIGLPCQESSPASPAYREAQREAQ